MAGSRLLVANVESEPGSRTVFLLGDLVGVVILKASIGKDERRKPLRRSVGGFRTVFRLHCEEEKDMRRTMPAMSPLPTPDYSLHLLYAALDYARKGYRIFPIYSLTSAGRCSCGQRNCQRPGQHPVVQSLNEATIDPVTIARWWHQYETASIGLLTGDGLLVIEVDPRRGGSLEDFMQFYAIPETAMVQTADGCWQLYFTYNPAFMLRATIDKFGLGTRSYGDGCYVVLPPSRGQQHSYSWHTLCVPEHLPSVLLPILIGSQIAHQSWPSYSLDAEA